jgi:phage-related protein
MALKRIPARFYRTDAGTEPAREGLKSLSADARRILGEDIKEVEFAWPLGRHWFVHQGVSCGRYAAGSRKARSRARFFLCVIRGEMVLLNGSIKKTQKTPPQEIELA